MNLRFFGISGIPMVQPGDDLVGLMNEGLIHMDETFENQDVVVIAQKIVSKSENRYVDLTKVSPGDEARQIAAKVDKDPRKVQVILDESKDCLLYTSPSPRDS